MKIVIMKLNLIRMDSFYAASYENVIDPRLGKHMMIFNSF